LVHAVRRFDLATGSPFVSYAVPTILGELKRHFRDRGWTVRPPRRIQELRPTIVGATADLTQKLGRSPTRAEVARHLDVDEAKIAEALTVDGCFTPDSLDRPVIEESGRSVTWIDATGRNDSNLDWVDFKLTLAPLLRQLSARDRLVLRLRFVEDLTQQQIGGIVGVSQMQVSRILDRLVGMVKIELAG
jgi:RNA polymerase sigma-B factor